MIWVNWFQGWENAPAIVKLCLETNLRYNGADVAPISWENCPVSLGKEYPGLKLDRLSLQAKSDLLRLALLYNYGGCWADATILWFGPLEESAWHDNVVYPRPKWNQTSGIMAQYFMCSAPGSYYITKLKASVHRYLLDRDSKVSNFHFLSYVFERCAKTDLDFLTDCNYFEYEGIVVEMNSALKKGTGGKSYVDSLRKLNNSNVSRIMPKMSKIQKLSHHKCDINLTSA